MKKTLLLATLLFSSQIFFSQTNFQRLYSAAPSTLFSDIKPTSNGGYIVCGNTGSSSTDALLSKLDANGIPQWTKHFGSWMGSEDAMTTGQTIAGGYYFVNSTDSYNPNGEMNFIVTDAPGNVIVNKSFTDNNGAIYPVSVTQTSSGDFVLASTYYDINTFSVAAHVIKTTLSGNIIWKKTFSDSSGTLQSEDMALCANGDVVIVGTSYSFTGEICLTRLDAASGNILWLKQYIPATDYASNCTIDNTADGGFIIAAKYIDATTFEYYILLTKVDVNGTIQWTNRHNANVTVQFSKSLRPKVKQAPDGGYIVSTHLYELATFISYPSLIKFDASGNFSSAKYYTLSMGYAYCYSKPQLTSDGGYVAAFNAMDSAFMNFSGHIVKTNASLSTGCFENSFTLLTFPVSFTVSSSTTTITAGTEVVREIVYGDIPLNYSDNCATNVSISEYETNDFISVYPNPSNGIFTIQSEEEITSVEIYNLLGEEIYLSSKANKNVIDLSNQSKGIYFVKIISGDKTYSQKIVVE